MLEIQLAAAFFFNAVSSCFFKAEMPIVIKITPLSGNGYKPSPYAFVNFHV